MRRALSFALTLLLCAHAAAETLRIEEDTLQELLGKAEDLETIVSLNAYLSDVRYEIERVETNMRGIDGLVSYSTVNLYLEEVTVASDPVTPKSTFGERVSARLNDSWNDFRRGLERFGVFALGELPLLLLSCLLYLLPIIVVIIVIIMLIRRARKKRRMKKMMPIFKFIGFLYARIFPLLLGDTKTPPL